MSENNGEMKNNNDDLLILDDFTDLLQTDSSWVSKAYCKTNKVDMQAFFPARGKYYESITLVQDTCDKCEVKTECLNYALDNCIRHGIWGGTSERQRRKMRREIKVVQSDT